MPLRNCSLTHHDSRTDRDAVKGVDLCVPQEPCVYGVGCKLAPPCDYDKSICSAAAAMRSVAIVTVTTCDFRFRAETDMHRADCLTWTIIQTGANWRIRWIDFRQFSSTRKIASRVV